MKTSQTPRITTYRERDVYLRQLSVDRTYTKIELGHRVKSSKEALATAFEFVRRGKHMIKGHGLQFIADSHHPATALEY